MDFKQLKLGMLTATMLAVGASASNAAVIFSNIIESESGAFNERANASDVITEFTIEGDAALFVQVDFNVTSTFDFLFLDYKPVNSGDGISGFSLKNLDTNSYETAAIQTCTSALINDSAFCQTIQGTSGTGTGTPPPISYLALDAGNYQLGFYESRDPSEPQADFQINEVPLPAGVLLMGTALAGFGVMRRRKDRKAA